METGMQLRIGALTLLLALAASHASAQALRLAETGSLSQGRPPNVVLIYADDLGYGDVSVQLAAPKLA